MTTQLRLLSNGELSERPARPRAKRTSVPPRPTSAASMWLDTRTRQIGQNGVSEARRRLAEIRATTDRAHELAAAS